MKGILVLSLAVLLSGPLWAQHQVFFQVIPPLCHGECSGSIQASVSGGTGPYSFHWLPGGATSNSLTGICKGNYTLTLTDGAGNTSSHTISVNEPDPIQFTTHSTPTLCGKATGELQVTATGGTGNLTYLFDHGDRLEYSNHISGLAAGIYCLSVYDQNYCIVGTCIYIYNTGGIEAVIGDLKDASCPEICDGAVLADTSLAASSAPFTIYYTKNNQVIDSGSVSAAGLCAGTYDLILANSDGCADTTAFAIQAGSSPAADFLISDSVLSSMNTHVEFQVNSPMPDVLYDWIFFNEATASGPVSHTQFPERPGYYPIQLIATSPAGCISQATASIRVKGEDGVYLPSAFSPNGDGLNEVFTPKGFGMDPEVYQFTIYDRFGQLIFSASKPHEGWDGRSPGGEIVSGLYLWKLRMKGFSGDLTEKEGTILLVK